MRWVAGLAAALSMGLVWTSAVFAGAPAKPLTTIIFSPTLDVYLDATRTSFLRALNRILGHARHDV